MNKLILMLLTVVALSVAWLSCFRWQLCADSFHNYEGERPEQTTFLLDRWTGKVWYAAPKSRDHYITPDFKPVFIDKSKPSEGF
jgi:hypothetical protein